MGELFYSFNNDLVREIIFRFIFLIGVSVFFKINFYFVRYLGIRDDIRRNRIYFVVLEFMGIEFMRFIIMKVFGENFYGYKFGMV